MNGYDPAAIRTFLARARATWTRSPRYVLLAGHGTYDYRDVRGSGDNLVPPMLTRTASGLFASDALFVSASEWDGAELAIGRLPATTSAELSQMVGRILSYEARQHDSWLVLADRDYDGEDYGTSAERAIASMPDFIRADLVRQTNSVDEARSAFVAGLADSPDAVLYFGHGGLDRMGRDGILRSDDLAALDPAVLPAVHFTMSCSVGRFEVPGFESLSEQLLRSPQGAVAIFSPSGQTNMEDADALAGFVVASLHEPGARLGDVTLSATQAYGSQNDAARLFNLLGDPAMRTAALDEVDADAGVHGDDLGTTRDAGVLDSSVPVPGVGSSGGACAVQIGSSTEVSMAWMAMLVIGAVVGRRSWRLARRVL